jgi:hypothetical protein
MSRLIVYDLTRSKPSKTTQRDSYVTLWKHHPKNEFSFRTNQWYHIKIDSITRMWPLESSKTDLRFEIYGRFKFSDKTDRIWKSASHLAIAPPLGTSECVAPYKVRRILTIFLHILGFWRATSHSIPHFDPQTTKSRHETLPQWFTSINEHNQLVFTKTHDSKFILEIPFSTNNILDQNRVKRV